MNRALRIAALLLGALTYTQPGRADDSELDGLLNETVVSTASKTNEVGSTAPATSTVITAEDMRRYGIHTISEAIDFLGLGGDSAGDTSMGTRGVNIEGDLSSHVLLLLDGHAVNDLYRASAPLWFDAGIPLELVDHIELVLGPGSVLYGSNAMLGVVNVITKRAKDFHGARVGLQSNVPFSLRAWGGVGYEPRIFGVASELTLALEFRKSNGPGQYDPAQHTGIDPVTGKPARYSTALAGTGTWGGAVNRGFSEQPALVARFVSGHFEAEVHATTFKTSQDFGFATFDDDTNRTITRRASLDLKYHAPISAVVDVSARLYADTMDSVSYFASALGRFCPHADTTCLFATAAGARWGGVELQSTFDWAKDGTLVTLVGVDPRLRVGLGKTDTSNDATGALLGPSVGVIDRTTAAIGAYAQQTWQPTTWLGLNGGARLDYEARFAPVVSPRVAAAVTPWRGGTLKAIYSQAFRAPTFGESYFTHPLEPIANNLRPESIRSVEVSIEQKFAGQRLLFGLFRSTLDDLIHLHFFSPSEAADFVRAGRGTTPPLSQYQNLDEITNYGFNAGYEGVLGMGTVRYGVNLTGAVARDADPTIGTVPLTTSPRMFGNARVSYVLPWKLPTIGLAAHFATKAPSEGAYAGHFQEIPYAPPQVVIRATLSGDVPWVPGLAYRVSADTKLANRGTPLSGPITAATPQYPMPDLQFVNRFEATVGLQYGF